MNVMVDAYASTITFMALTGVFAYSFYAVLVAGQLSLAQAGIASAAAFTSSLAVPAEPLFGVLPRLVVGIAVGMSVGAFLAFLLGLPVMRLRGVFLAIATLAFGEVVRILLINQSWTGGAQGLSFPKLVGIPQAWLALAAVAYWFWRLGGSRLGRAFAAIREDELAARAMGIDVSRHRMTAFVTSGAVAGLYGVMLAYFVRFAEPNAFGFSAAVDGLVTAVVGGTTLFVGPLLGSTFLTWLPELQRAIGVEAGWIRPFVSGLLLLLVILFLPGGLAALIPHRRQIGWCVGVRHGPPPPVWDEGGGGPWRTPTHHPICRRCLHQERRSPVCEPSGRTTAGSMRCATSTSTSQRVRSWVSSVPMVPARPRWSTSCPGSCPPVAVKGRWSGSPLAPAYPPTASPWPGSAERSSRSSCSTG